MVSPMVSRINRASLLLIAAVLVCGCGKPDSVDTLTLQVSKLDHLSQAMEMAMSESEFDFNEFQRKIEGGLNRWVASDDAQIRQIEWKAPATLEKLPANAKDSDAFRAIDSKQFLVSDAHYLKSMVWMDAIAKRVEAGEPVAGALLPPGESEVPEEGGDEPLTANERMAAALQKAHEGLDEASAEKLATTVKLFDWVVRNIYQVELIDWPTPELVEENRLFDGDSDWPPSVGVAGPGYQRMVWQSMLYGRGDALEMYRIFVGLAANRDIDVCLLGTPTGDKERFRPQVAAASIGGQLYLFDIRLGLPLPGAKPGQIATLADVKADPSLLKRLDLKVEESIAEDVEYWLTEQDLEELVVLVDVAPEAISYRMSLLEANLAGDQRMKISIQLDEMIARLTQHDEIDDVQVWATPFCAPQYRAAVGQAMAMSRFNDDIKQKLSWHPFEEGYVDNFPRLRTAKSKYLIGQFETRPNEPDESVMEHWQALNYSDGFISALDTDTSVQKSLGLDARTMGVQNFEAKKQLIRKQLQLIRVDSVYFLALSHLENGNPGSTINWGRRADSMDDRFFWTENLSYNLGRAHEALHQYDKAIEIYSKNANEKKLAPQTHGNLIRARMLKQAKGD